MKKLFLLLAVVAISHSIVFPQGCLPEGITFTTQEEIDNFQTNFPGCTEIEGDVYIGKFPEGTDINNLNGLNEVTTIVGNLRIFHNASLTSLSGLENLTSTGGKLYISNTNMVDFMGLNALEFIGGDFIVIQNYSLQSFMGLESLTNIGGSIILSGLYQLTDISALEGLSELTGNLSIEDVGLTSLYGLHNIITIDGYLSLYECCDIVSFEGLQSLNYIGGNFEINSNTDAINLSGLENLQTIGGDFVLVNNNFITMEGLTGLQTVGGFGISFHFSLINLNGLENLTEVNGGFGFAYCDVLTDINGIQNVSPGSINALGIFYNQMLAECDITSICQYLIAPGGSVEIHHNAPGCNSPEEVEEHCLTSVAEISAKEAISLFPNPATSFITIQIQESIPVEQVIIFNHLGQKVLETKPVNNTVDVSGLKAGMYMVEAVTDGTRYRTKMIKNN